MTEPMNCTETQNLFSTLADSELDAAAVGRLEEHLATCRHCAQDWRLFKESMALLQEIEPVAAPADLLMGIHAKLEQTNPLIDWLRDLFGSPLRSLSSLSAIAIAIFFWAAPHNNTIQTASNTIANNVGDITRTRSLIPQLKTISVMNPASRTWADSSSTPPYHLLVPPSLTPDIAITVHATSRAARNRLYQRLSMQKHWRIHSVRDGLLIYLAEQDLHLLRHTLAPHRFTILAPPHPPVKAGGRRLRAVSLHIETQ